MPAPLIPALLILAGVVLFGLLAQSLAVALDRRRYPRPGTTVEVDGCALHVRVSGTAGQPVVLEAGIAASSVGWARVQPALAAFTRVCSYDRAGIAWSLPSACARTPDQFLREMLAVVLHAGAPAILVGHSFGGLLVRLFAARHPEHVAGVVLVDPPLLSEWAEPTPRRAAMLRRGIALSRRGSLLARFGIVRFGIALAAARAGPLPRWIARASSGAGGTSAVQRLAGEVLKLPPELLPVVRAHWSRHSSFTAMAEHLAALPDVASAAARANLNPDLPVIVISAGHLTETQLAEHRGLASLRHVVAHGSGHWVHLDRPELIVDAVLELMRHDHR